MTFHFPEARQHIFPYIPYPLPRIGPLQLKPYSPYVKKTSIERELPLSQSFKGVSNTLNHTTPFHPSPKQVRSYTNPAFFQSCFNPFYPSPINKSGISKSPQEKISFSLIEPQLLPCTPAYGYKFYALAVYLHPTLAAHEIRGTFGIQSNICGGAFLRK